ncbi:hypothetical protein ACTFIV_003115 [Dictyostelium citrinum]
MKFLIIITLIIFYYINLINSATIIINADPCIGKSNCYYNDIYNLGATSADDLVFVTTDPTAQPVVNVPSRDLLFNSLNISNVVLNFVTQGKFTVSKSVYVGPKGVLILSSPVKSVTTDLIIDGSFSINGKSGGLNVTNNFNASSGSTIEFAGSIISIGGLNIKKNVSSVFKGISVTTIKNYANFESNIKLIDSASLTLLNGNVNILGNITSTLTSRIDVYQTTNIHFGPSTEFNLDCTMKLLSGSNLFFSGSNININNVVPGSITNLYLSSNSIVNINNRTTALTYDYISIIEHSQITFDNSYFNVDTLTSSSDSIINIKYQNFQFNNNITINAQFNLINSELTIGSNVNFNVVSGLNVDSQSNIIIPNEAILSISGGDSSNIISKKLNIQGMLIINNSSIQFNQGLNSSEDSIISFNNSMVTINANCNFNSPVYCYGNSIVNLSMGSSFIEFNGGLNTEMNSIISLQSSQIKLNSTSNIFGQIKLNNGTITSLGSTKITNSITSDKVNLNNNLNINSGFLKIDTKNTIAISGIINLLNNTSLTINDATVSVGDSIINNGGAIEINSLIIANYSISQTSIDSKLSLLKGANIMSAFVNLQSGKISGTGSISSDKCQCGATINSNEIIINGDLELLNTAILQIEINDDKYNYSKIIVSGNVIINNGGIIDIISNNIIENNNNNNPTFQIISCTGETSVINGSLSISVDNLKLFKSEISKSGKSYNLILKSSSSPSSSSSSSLSSSSSTTTNNPESTSTTGNNSGSTITPTTTSGKASTTGVNPTTTTSGKNVDQTSTSTILVSSLLFIILSFILTILF